LIRLFGARDLHRTMMATDDAARRLSRYFLTQLALNTAFGCVIGLGLLLIGVPSPVLWGIVAVLMRFLPYVGSFLSASLPLALAAAVDPGWSLMAWTGALFLVSEVIMGEVVEPLVYGHSTGLSPVSVVVAAIFWGWLWGPIGLILSMLKDRSLSSYYDEIAIPGLQLAALDIERDVLTEDQIARIRGGVEDLLGELSDHDDSDPAPRAADSSKAGPSRDQQKLAKSPAPESDAAPGPETLPPAWRAPSAVLCVAGRGPLDGSASAMLAQLLGKHGLGARVAPHAVVGSGAALASVDLEGVMMVCLCYASISGTPSHLRYTVRRLRSHLPTATILVGLLPTEVLGDDRLRVAIAADRYAASLRGAVTAASGMARFRRPRTGWWAAGRPAGTADRGPRPRRRVPRVRRPPG